MHINMKSQERIYPLIMDIHNWIMDTHYQIMDTQDYL